MQGQVSLGFVGRNREIIEAVKAGQYDLGIVASENSIEGNVEETIKAIINSDLTILGERILPIHQAIFGSKVAFNKQMINSHPQGFAQCGQWISENLSNPTIIQHGSTAEAVRIAAEKDELAIGSPVAGKVYDIPLIEEGVEDNKKINTTRFWLVGKGETEVTGKDRTRIIVTLQNAPGTLAKVVNAFADRNISINKVDTSPLTLGHYYFLLSVDGHVKEPHVAEALEEIEEYCWKLKLLGSFQKSTLENTEYEPEAYEKDWVPKHGSGVS